MRAVSVWSSLLFFLTVIFSGCQGAGSSDMPPDIRYGQEVCEECRMIISEEAFSSGLRSKGGKQYKFDSIGCMLKFLETNPGFEGAVWVHDFETQDWIRGKNAYFVLSGAMPTPMGDGLFAFPSEKLAQTWAREMEGEIQRWPPMPGKDFLEKNEKI